MRLDPVYIRFKKREKNNPSDNQPINPWVPKLCLEDTKGCERTVGDTGNLLYLDCGVCYLGLYTFIKTHLIVHFQWLL